MRPPKSSSSGSTGGVSRLAASRWTVCISLVHVHAQLRPHSRRLLAPSITIGQAAVCKSEDTTRADHGWTGWGLTWCALLLVLPVARCSTMSPIPNAGGFSVADHAVSNKQPPSPRTQRPPFPESLPRV